MTMYSVRLRRHQVCAIHFSSIQTGLMSVPQILSSKFSLHNIPSIQDASQTFGNLLHDKLETRTCCSDRSVVPFRTCFSVESHDSMSYEGCRSLSRLCIVLKSHTASVCLHMAGLTCDLLILTTLDYMSYATIMQACYSATTSSNICACPS